MKTSTPNMLSQEQELFPRWVLRSVGALLLFTMVSVAAIRLTGNGPDQLEAQIVAERFLRFEDSSDGGVAVIDGVTGELLTTVHGEQGFLRGALRALSRERRARKLGPEQPFQLTATADGRTTLFDPATQQRVELGSFGPTNAGSFAPFLTMQPAKAASN